MQHKTKEQEEFELYSFLTGSKHNYIHSKLFSSLQNNEIALKLQILKTGTNVDIYYKVLSFESLIECIQTKKLPFHLLSCSEILYYTKPHSKFFIVMKNWDIHILNPKKCMFLLQVTFYNFWTHHLLLKHYKLNPKEHFVFVEKQFPNIHTYFHFIIDKYCFSLKLLKTIFREYQNYIDNLHSIIDCNQEEFFYFQSIVKDENLGYVDCSVYKKNAKLQILHSFQIANDPFINMMLTKKLFDPYSALLIHSNATISVKMKQSLITFIEDCQFIPFQSSLRIQEETNLLFSPFSLMDKENQNHNPAIIKLLNLFLDQFLQHLDVNIKKKNNDHKDRNIKTLIISNYIIHQEYIEAPCTFNLKENLKKNLNNNHYCIFSFNQNQCQSSASSSSSSSSSSSILESKHNSLGYLKLLVSFWAITLQCYHQTCSNKKNKLWYPLSYKNFSALIRFPEIFSKMFDNELNYKYFIKTNQNVFSPFSSFPSISLSSFFDLDSSRNLLLPPNWEIEEYNEPVVKDYFQTGYKWHLEQSGMCTQKTIKWLELIKRWEDKSFSYCIIGPRISFVINTYNRIKQFFKNKNQNSTTTTTTTTSRTTMNNNFDFYLYHTKEFHEKVLFSENKRYPPQRNGLGFGSDQTNSPKHRPLNIVITYESLWQISNNSFDVIIIDEVTTLLTCVSSATNKTKLPANAACFHKLLTESKHILLLDADLNAKCLDLVFSFQNHFTEKVLFRINKYRNPQLKKTILFYSDRPKSLHFSQNVLPKKETKETKETTKATKTYLDLKTNKKKQKNIGKQQFIASIKYRILQGQRIVIITGSIKFFEEEIQPELIQKEIYYKWYKQGNGNDIDLDDINHSWNETQIIIKKKKKK